MSESILLTSPRILDSDDIYESLIYLNRGGPLEQDNAMLAALVLTLANHIGDACIVKTAISHVQQAFKRSETSDFQNQTR